VHFCEIDEGAEPEEDGIGRRQDLESLASVGLGCIERPLERENLCPDAPQQRLGIHIVVCGKLLGEAPQLLDLVESIECVERLRQQTRDRREDVLLADSAE